MEEKRITTLGDLSNELFCRILDYIEGDPEKFIDVHRRAYLSVESFKPPPPHFLDQSEAIGNFRRVCKRFAALGIPYQYTRVATRFSTAGFERLRRIAEQPHLARAVKKFTYLVPSFYREGHADFKQLVKLVGFYESLWIDIPRLTAKANEQKDIIDTQRDVDALTFAITEFSSLQHIQLLRLQDQFDRDLLVYLRRNEATGRYIREAEHAAFLVQLEWTAACSHATKTIAQALVSSKSPASRFSGPMMDPQSAMTLRGSPRTTISSLASRLTCLELHFDDPTNLNDKMRALSPLFKCVFAAAVNMQAVHIGFPARSPLALPLEDIFHEVQWKNLRAFGIQAWELNGAEIVKLARRHQETLRGLRLRDVILKESMWKNVLTMLRAEMTSLEWVSLRRIGYASHFDEFVAGAVDLEGRTMYQVPPHHDSEDEWEEHAGPDTDHEAEDDQNSDGSEVEANAPTDEDDHDHDDDGESVAHSGASDHGPDADGLELESPLSASFCTCGRAAWSDDPDDLGDNGEHVTYRQRKMWEQWVIGRCSAHRSRYF